MYILGTLYCTLFVWLHTNASRLYQNCVWKTHVSLHLILLYLFHHCPGSYCCRWKMIARVCLCVCTLLAWFVCISVLVSGWGLCVGECVIRRSTCLCLVGFQCFALFVFSTRAIRVCGLSLPPSPLSLSLFLSLSLCACLFMHRYVVVLRVPIRVSELDIKDDGFTPKTSQTPDKLSPVPTNEDAGPNSRDHVTGWIKRLSD